MSFQEPGSGVFPNESSFNIDLVSSTSEREKVEIDNFTSFKTQISAAGGELILRYELSGEQFDRVTNIPVDTMLMIKEFDKKGTSLFEFKTEKNTDQVIYVLTIAEMKTR